MDLELRHLRALCVIADAGSITRAASVLGVSQPSLTAQLQRVEREIGGQVFTRHRQGVHPTRLGDYVLTRARTVLLAMDDLHRTAVRQTAATHDAVRLGGIHGRVSVGLADRLGDHLPGIEVRLQAEYSPRLLWELMLAERLDAVALVDYQGFELRAPPAVLSEVFVVEPVFVALWADHDLAARDEVDLADLADQSWALTPPDGAGWPDCYHRACERAGFVPRVPYVISDAAQIREMVELRRAISPCQATFPASEGVVVRPLVGSPVKMRHLLVCRRDGPLAGHFAELVRTAREVYWDYARQRPDYLSWLHRHSVDTGLTARPADDATRPGGARGTRI